MVHAKLGERKTAVGRMHADFWQTTPTKPDAVTQSHTTDWHFAPSFYRLLLFGWKVSQQCNLCINKWIEKSWRIHVYVLLGCPCIVFCSARCSWVRGSTVTSTYSKRVGTLWALLALCRLLAMIAVVVHKCEDTQNPEGCRWCLHEINIKLSFTSGRPGGISGSK